MEGRFKYDERYDGYFRMPEAMLPPSSLYRFQPDSISEDVGLCSELSVHRQSEADIRERSAVHQERAVKIAGLLPAPEGQQGGHQQRYVHHRQLIGRTIPMVLRFLYATRFNYAETYAQLLNYFRWRNTDLPIVLTQEAVTMLVNKCKKN